MIASQMKACVLRSVAVGLLLVAATQSLFSAERRPDSSELRTAAVRKHASQSIAATSPSYAIRTEHPKILLSDPETVERLKHALAVRTPAATRFKDYVDSELKGRRHYAFQPWHAALLFHLTGEDAYATYAIEVTEQFVASEEERIASGRRPAVASDSYLEIGQQVGNIALVYDWCHSRLNPEMRARWTSYANTAVGNVWDHTRARWGGIQYPWTGWAVDNPSNNYYYSFLRATMLLGLATHGENEMAQRWINLFRFEKVEKQLLPLLARDLEGGGSREGTGYGVAMARLWQLYYWWERSTGENLATRTPHTFASMAYALHSIAPTLDRIAPTGDHSRESTAALFDSHREYLLVLQSIFSTERLAGISKNLLESSSVPRMSQGYMLFADFLYEQPLLRPRKLSELNTVYWAPGTGQLMMRSAWDPTATYVNFICGPYTESHAHRDQGSFVLFNGTWLTSDANIYSHSGIEQDEEMHNLVRFEVAGSTVKQTHGTACALAALGDNPYFTYASARVTPVFRKHPAVARSERELLFLKPNVVIVLDRAASSAGRRIWTLNFGGDPHVAGDMVRFVDGRSKLEVLRVSPAGLHTEVRRWPEMRKGMRGGVRIDVADSGGTSSVFLHVFAINGAVAGASRADMPGQTGVRINLSDGRVATVRFSTEGTGGTLDLRAADQSLQFSGPLPTLVASPPLFSE